MYLKLTIRSVTKILSVEFFSKIFKEIPPSTHPLRPLFPGNFRFTSNFTGINGTSPNDRPFPEFKISSRERARRVDYNSSFRRRLSLYYGGKYYLTGANSVCYVEHSTQNCRVMCQLTLCTSRKFQGREINMLNISSLIKKKSFFLSLLLMT